MAVLRRREVVLESHGDDQVAHNWDPSRRLRGHRRVNRAATDRLLLVFGGSGVVSGCVDAVF